MAIEHLTQEQIDKIILDGAKASDVTGEKTISGDGSPSEDMGEDHKGGRLDKAEQNAGFESSRIRRRGAVRRDPEKRSLIYNRSNGYRVVVLGGNERNYREADDNENDLPPEFQLRKYAFFTFDLRSGSIDDSTRSLFRSLVGRLLDTSYSELASPMTKNILVARFNSREGVLNGIYRAYPSRYRVHTSSSPVPIYDTELVFYGPVDDQERFYKGLEAELRKHSSFSRGAIYVQKELRLPLGNYLDEQGIGITAECDLGSFPREKKQEGDNILRRK